MPRRGEVYYPTTVLPPGTPTKHMVVLVSPTAQLQNAQKSFVSVVLIRSVADPLTGAVRPLGPMGHAFRITPKQCPFLRHDSIIETHQLLALPLQELIPLRPEGSIPDDVLDKVLESIRRLFT